MLIITAGTAHAQITQIVNSGFEDRTPLPASEGDCVTGEARGRFAPDPWVITNTPDYNTEREIGFSVNYEERTNLPGFNTSPSGGCFQSMRNSEGVTQDIVIADASEPLKWTYDYTEYTRPGFTQCTPNIEFRINSTTPSTGTVVGSAPNVGTADGPAAHGSWVVTETPPFTPSDFGVADGDTVSIYFGSNSTCSATWGYVDGIAIVPAVAILQAADNDYTTAPIAPGVAGTTPSVFGNDTVNGAAFAPADVTVSITDDGSAFGATINSDGTIDIPAGVAPGIYEITYEICDVNDPSNCDTAIAKISIQTSVADAHINPNVCGNYLSQGWITHGKLNLHDTEVRIGSGDFETDPYLYLPIERDADGRITTYFGPNSGTNSGTISTPAASNLVSTSNSAADHQSEMHVIVYRLDGAPGATLTADLNTRAAQEYTAYWIEDSAGNVIAASDFEFTTGTPNIGGIGDQLPLSFTAPADGIAYLHAVIFDPTVAYGRPIISNYECPAPSLSMTKVADSQGPHKAGDVVTYTYTVTNDGNVSIENIAITDTHNGSDPAPTPGNETLLTDAGTAGDSTDAVVDGTWDVLAPEDVVTFTGTYTVTATDAANL